MPCSPIVLSTEEMKGNQLRLYLSALAYRLAEALRRLALKGTEWGPKRRWIRSGSSCSKSAPSNASAPGTCGWSSVPTIRGSRFMLGPSTRYDADRLYRDQTAVPHGPKNRPGGNMPQIQPRSAMSLAAHLPNLSQGRFQAD